MASTKVPTKAGHPASQLLGYLPPGPNAKRQAKLKQREEDRRNLARARELRDEAIKRGLENPGTLTRDVFFEENPEACE